MNRILLGAAIGAAVGGFWAIKQAEKNALEHPVAGGTYRKEKVMMSGAVKGAAIGAGIGFLFR